MAAVAVIGLGNIGGGVAANLVAAGHEVAVFDPDDSRAARSAAAGCRAMNSAASAATGAEAVFTSLPGPAQVRAVGVGSGASRGILDAMEVGATWVELSTNDIETATDMHGRAADRGIAFIDAPVSGGPEGASAGTLSIFVGGSTAHVEAMTPLLGSFGAKVDHVGPLGAGIAAKLAQVTLCYTQTVTLIEALLLGVRAGVDPDTMLDLVRNSAGGSYVADTYGPEILAGTYDASFPLGHAAKDMRLAMELAGAVHADLPVMSAVADLYCDAEASFGSAAPHLLAARVREDQNQTVLHRLCGEHPTTDGSTRPERPDPSPREVSPT